jgi:hypothetical protein
LWSHIGCPPRMFLQRGSPKGVQLVGSQEGSPSLVPHGGLTKGSHPREVPQGGSKMEFIECGSPKICTPIGVSKWVAHKGVQHEGPPIVVPQGASPKGGTSRDVPTCGSHNWGPPTGSPMRCPSRGGYLVWSQKVGPSRVDPKAGSRRGVPIEGPQGGSRKRTPKGGPTRLDTKGGSHKGGQPSGVPQGSPQGGATNVDSNGCSVRDPPKLVPR